MNEEKQRKKSPILALVLSAIFPGLGQIYVEKVTKGLFLIGFDFLISFLLREPLQRVVEAQEAGSTPDDSTLLVAGGYSIALLVLWIYSIIDAKKTAEMINKEEPDAIT